MRRRQGESRSFYMGLMFALIGQAHIKAERNGPMSVTISFKDKWPRA